jgi:hypothetical protein
LFAGYLTRPQTTRGNHVPQIVRYDIMSTITGLIKNVSFSLIVSNAVF